MNRYHLNVSDNSDELAISASNAISNEINLSIQKYNKCNIALAGGSTPLKTYNLLKDIKLDWKKVHLFLGDERFVPSDDISSNSLMISQNLLTGSLASQASFHPIKTDNILTPLASASLYSKYIEDFFVNQSHSFDLVLLGLGSDGHTASLFPYSPSLNVKDESVTTSLGNGIERITLTANLLSSARNVFFLVSGSDKRIALQRLLSNDEDANRTPAKLVRPDSIINIFTDKLAYETT